MSEVYRLSLDLYGVQIDPAQMSAYVSHLVERIKQSGRWNDDLFSHVDVVTKPARILISPGGALPEGVKVKRESSELSIREDVRHDSFLLAGITAYLLSISWLRGLDWNVLMADCGGAGFSFRAGNLSDDVIIAPLSLN